MLYMVQGNLGCKDVVNLCDGKILGRISDVEIDSCNGRISAFAVSSGGIFCGKEQIRIPWENVRCLGEDAILVEWKESEKTSCCDTRRSKKWGWLLG